MTIRRRRALACGVALTVAVGALTGAATGASASAGAGEGRSETALTWYDVTAKTVGAAGLPQVTASRTWAIGWISAGRALRSGKGRNFQDAALASAVHDALRPLVPAQVGELDAALARTLDGIPDGRAKKAGVRAGQEAAQRTLDERAGDGLTKEEISNDGYEPPAPAPGVWRKTPPLDRPAVQPNAGRAKPFLLGTPDRFRPGPSPALDSPRYRRDLAEVREYGRDTSTVRSPEQTGTAKFWSSSSISLYGAALRAVLQQGHYPPTRAAGLVAAFHAVTADAQIAVYDAKYVHLRWRPITAVQADDPGWKPLITTPQHPEYPGGHSTYAGAAERVLTRLTGSGPDRPIRLVSNGEVRTYSSWRDMTRDNVDGRVWSGIHFRFSDEIGAGLGARVAGWDLPQTWRLFR